MAKASVTSYTGENVFSLTEDKMMKLTNENKLQTPSDPKSEAPKPLVQADLLADKLAELDKMFDSLD